MSASNISMEMYQHDSSRRFRFVLRGQLAGTTVYELEAAWTTAKSILAGKELVVDIHGVTEADPSGIQLLCRMRESGARIDPAMPSDCGDLINLQQAVKLHSASAFKRMLRQMWEALATERTRTFQFRASAPKPGTCFGTRPGTGCPGD